ncbi:hypothetical protein AGABI2DRAFT_217774 [Agaricus bisporus var. bisporus H97]|uniref:hypothetical protein n=1 Tax=Agaricus bisporus var. bisporus (strain H97 / ATCC MYA-4626 / FGSC 10389) TaxID=936046 RepID=UPI00029F5A54|nr:hypothetical protein AGABI2DRAFT_217774 [Agaricus bisporus var. bisporus H97]EKV48862.1 hypothetical protein AGABI2DRAFT_217774 [Agaricus bisporus var. bisporus H97]
MSSTHLKTPTHSHPLLSEEQPSRGRRRRAATPQSSSKTPTNYFTLKAQLEEDTVGQPNWDGSVRGYGHHGRGKHRTDIREQDRPSISSLWDSQQQIGMSDSDRHGPLVTSHVLATRWHDCSDDAIEGAISKLTAMESPGDVVHHPYFTALRILASAYHRLLVVRQDLEEHRRGVQDKEDARRRRADELLHELQASDRDTARRVIQSIFTDDDEGVHRVQRKQSSQSLIDSLSEAIADEVPLSRTVPKPMTPTPEEITDQLTHSSQASISPSVTPVNSTPIPESSSLSASSLDEIKTQPSLQPPALDSNDRASKRDWMGTLWGKSRASHAPDLQAPVASAGSSSDENALPGRTPGRDRRASARSVFGTLGISILNPIQSASSKRRTVADDVPPPHSTSDDARSTKSNIASDNSSFVDHSDAHSARPSTIPSAKSISSSSEPPVVVIQGATLRAITHATRVMSNDPSSILTDQGRETGPLIATLAMNLIRNAREGGIVFREKSWKDRKDAGVKKEETAERPTATLSSNAGADAAMALNRALNLSDGLKKKMEKSSALARVSSPFASPLFGSFGRQQSNRKSSVPSSSNQTGPPSQPVLLQPKPKLGSVPLESIIPETSKPPTHYLSRPSALTSFTSHDFRFSLPLAPHFQSASRFSVQSGDHDEQGKAIGPLLTDRYGFMYDIALYDVLLLIRAKECGNSAPACLTGVKIADRVEDNSWPEDDDSKSIGTGSARGRSGEGIEVVKGECLCDGEADASSVVGEHVEELPSLDAQSSSAKSRSSSKSGRRSSSVLPSSATTASNTTNNGGTGRGSTSFAASILSVNDNTPRHACTKTIRKLLDQLTEIHDQQQAAQQKEWSIFVKQRSRVKPSSNKPSSSNQPTGPANTLLNSIGLGLSNDDADDADELGHTEGLINFAQLGNSTERREFDKLVRNGIPLCYRSKVWMECSGALELKEPGLFKDLLGATEKNGEELGSVVAEIEKDVGRTMPLNIFFGGDGAGVDKLRRVLIAYSRRNPAVGYCQGMNLITSTILLVHADEEDAFWMLAAIVEKILPEDFFSPSLLPSRACPLVLLDYVVEHLPKLHAHLMELEIDLGAICFSWFLSLFTDCLPVETLFRVWDVFLVDGLDVLFRLAFGILRKNEQELLACESIPAVYVALESLPTRMWEADKLLQAEAELRPVLVHSDITAKRNKHVNALSQLMSQ